MATTYVLVHGAFIGGWCWRHVAERLRAEGHTVFTPTLTGCGERSHLATRETGLRTHVQDIIGVIDFEELSDIVLVGHSYSGMVVGEVAAERRDRVRALVFMDAYIPRDGVSVLDFNPPERREAFHKAVDAFDGWRTPPHSAEYYGVRDTALQGWIDRKVLPHPVKCLAEKARVPADTYSKIGRCGYVLCVDPPLPVMRQFHDWAQGREGWTAQEFAGSHFLMMTDPERTSQLLLAYD